MTHQQKGSAMIHTTHAVDLLLLDPILEKYKNRKRDALLPMLHEAQAVYGWLPREVQEAVGGTLRVPLADIHGVIEFYTMFYNEPTAKRVIRVCQDSACHLAGAGVMSAAIERQLGLNDGETSDDGQVTYEQVPCLGMCEHAPNALNGDKPGGNLTVETVGDFLSAVHPEPEPRIYGSAPIKVARVGQVDPYSLEDYKAHDGYAVLEKVLPMTPEAIMATLKASAVLGRGGAMFPVNLKWEFTRAAPGSAADKHIVANVDESEPGTFKDRALIDGDPFSLIEAMTIAAYAVGAENGWIFVRGEYPRSFERLSNAVEKARAAGYLGRNILGQKGFHFDIEMRKGAGAYICGEETALIEAIEGKRGFPRIKPPFPVTNGLFDQPTALNNVETLVAAMAVLNVGLEEWLKYGTEQSPGTKWFCLSGHIARPGLYEVPFGLTIRELIEMAGSIPSGKEIQAVLLGGAAGVFISPAGLDMPLTYEDARAYGVPLGSGVIQVYDESVDLRDILFRLSRFFAHESCGKCFPCQIGTQRQMEILDRIAHGGGSRNEDGQILRDVGFAMTETSLCGLGQTASTAVISAMDLWPELLQ
jgi:NADH-quinone oxidoreductase subunit F